jgi:hypothetical protein
MMRPKKLEKGIVTISSPVRGRIDLCGDLVIATLDRQARDHAQGRGKLWGIGAFDRDTLELRWVVWDIPALAAVTGETVYAYSRGGVVLALGRDGQERWRSTLTDDRSLKAQERGDRDSPFVPDVIPAGSSVYLAAGGEILRLDAGDGRELTRVTVCAAPRGVVNRLSRNGERGLVATCTERTGWDDEIFDLGPPLQRPPPLESLRTAPSDLVAFDFDLRERWRLPPTAGSVYDHRPPVALENGGIACLVGEVVSEGNGPHLRLFGGWIFVADGRNGNVRWRREIHSNYSLAGPVAVSHGVIDGGSLTYYEISDGTPWWEVRPDQNGIDPTVTPTLDGQRLLVAGRMGIRAVDLHDGSLSDVAPLGVRPFNGSIVTPLLRDGDKLFVGVEEAGVAKLLRISL